MPYKKQHPYLTRDIQLLPLSARAKKLFAAAGFSTLKEFLKLSYYEWEAHVPGFTARYRKEMVGFLFDKDLGKYLKTN